MRNARSIPTVLWAFLAGLLLAGCNGLQPEPEVFEPNYEPEVEVFGLLGPGPPYNFVIVERTVTIEEYNRIQYNFERIPTVIEDARVEIGSSTDTVLLAFHREAGAGYFFYETYRRKGMYLDPQGRLRGEPGVPYRLRVELPDGRRISGQTRVPGVPRILTPASGRRLDMQQVRRTEVAWTKAAGAAAYELALYVDQYYWTPEGYRYGGERNVLGDFLTDRTQVELSKLVSSVYFPEGIDSLRARLEVLAIDPNYYDYIRSNSGLAQLSGLQLNLLEGGRGAFGSVSVDSVRFTLVR